VPITNNGASSTDGGAISVHDGASLALSSITFTSNHASTTRRCSSAGAFDISDPQRGAHASTQRSMSFKCFVNSGIDIEFASTLVLTSGQTDWQ
jgi:hypothetical protein